MGAIQNMLKAGLKKVKTSKPKQIVNTVLKVMSPGLKKTVVPKIPKPVTGKTTSKLKVPME